MKKIKKSTWISLSCVVLAMFASGLYGTSFQKKTLDNAVSLVSEVSTPNKAKPAQTNPQPTPFMPPQKSESLPASNLTSAKAEETPPVEPTSPPLTFQLPTTGETTLPYSDQELVFFPVLKEWRCHLGIDFIPSDNDKVFAVADGTVETTFNDPLYGTTVCINHGNDLKSYYASLSAVSVLEGQVLKQGAEVGNMGDSATIEDGVHLHFYMTKNDIITDPFGKKE